MNYRNSFDNKPLAILRKNLSGIPGPTARWFEARMFLSDDSVNRWSTTKEEYDFAYKVIARIVRIN